MWNKPTRQELTRLPALYATEDVPLKEKEILMHFFIGGCDWYIAEFDGEDTFFGFAILNNDFEMAEWGYASLSELTAINIRGIEIDRDLYWEPCKAYEVPRIKEAQQWT